MCTCMFVCVHMCVWYVYTCVHGMYSYVMNSVREYIAMCMFLTCGYILYNTETYNNIASYICTDIL